MLMMLIQLDVAKKNDCDGYWGLVVVITMDGDNKRMDRWMNEWGCKKKRLKIKKKKKKNFNLRNELWDLFFFGSSSSCC